jgi:predicted phosphoribosyltransferase
MDRVSSRQQTMSFRDRKDAGERLAQSLASYRNSRPVVLALPRGGVPVAAEVARSLDAPLDLVLVRKIGAPGQPELAMGAVVEGTPPLALRNEDVIGALDISDRDFNRVREREIAELERRRQAYLADRPRVDVAGRTAIVVDDGIATGMTVRAAARAAAARGAKQVVIAAPVAAASVAAELRSEVDAVVCVEEPEDLFAIGYFYADFRQIGDDEVRGVLAQLPACAAD